MIRFASIISLALLAPIAAPAQTPAAERALDRAIRRYDGIRTIRSTFEQRITNPFTGNTHLAKGETIQLRPGRISINFTEPADDRIVVDGRFIWVYTPSSTPGQVLRLPVGAAGGTAPDVVGELLTEPRKRYTITDAGTKTSQGRALQGLALTPKTDTAANELFATATVWVDTSGIVREFELTDVNGLKREVRFITQRFNTKLPDDAFLFVIPKGVRVVDPASASR